MIGFVLVEIWKKKYNNMKKVFRLTESQLNRISKKILNESFMGIISYEDTVCEIICKLKVAKTGSRGDVVKMIQHLLDANGFNVKREGGGMRAGCSKEYPSCDGIFKSHTKDAVMEFQRSIPGLTVDGVVGYNTWKAMCDNLTFTYSLPKDKFCLDCPCDDDFQNDDDFKDIDIFDPIKTIDDVDCDKLKKCVKDNILVPAPDYLKFEKCIGGGKVVNERDWDCKLCNETFPYHHINQMPIAGGDPDYNKYINYLGKWCYANCDGFKMIY